MKVRNAIVILLLVLAGAAAFYHEEKKQEAVAMAEPALRLGGPGPAFELKSLEGQAYQVGGRREKPLLLNFWASWCESCQEEAPLLVQMFEKYKDELDLLAVNATGSDKLEAAQAFAKRYRFSFPVLLDHSLEIVRVYRVQAVPTSFLIDREGNIVDVIHVLEPAELEQKLEKLIRGQ